MAKTYYDYMLRAQDNRVKLDEALKASDSKNIIYYRGKYVAELQKAFRLNPNGIVPASVTGSASIRIEDAIKAELKKHKTQITYSIQKNKLNANIKNLTLVKEVGLKIKRLSTDASLLKHASTKKDKVEAKKQVAKSTLGVVGSVVKSPVMVASKVLSTVGPLAIIITTLPLQVLNLGVSMVIDIQNGTVKDNPYSDTFVHQMSKCLGDAVKSVSKSVYNVVGRL